MNRKIIKNFIAGFSGVVIGILIFHFIFKEDTRLIFKTERYPKEIMIILESRSGLVEFEGLTSHYKQHEGIQYEQTTKIYRYFLKNKDDFIEGYYRKISKEGVLFMEVFYDGHWIASDVADDYNDIVKFGVDSKGNPYQNFKDEYIYMVLNP
ncbi:MAG: hypothetical protein WBB37_10735 [bacterium]